MPRNRRAFTAPLRSLLALRAAVLATLDTLLGPGGVQAVVIGNLLLNLHRLMINRPRRQALNLAASPGLLLGKVMFGLADQLN